MANNSFVKIAGIDGESTDKEHKGWIELHSYTFGSLQEQTGSSISKGGALTSGRSHIQDFTISKDIDKATPKLLEACLKGKHIDKIELSVARQTGADGGATEFFTYTLEQCLCTGVSQGGGGDSLPTESVSFVGVKHAWKYTETDTKGAKKGNTETKYDLSTNT